MPVVKKLQPKLYSKLVLLLGATTTTNQIALLRIVQLRVAMNTQIGQGHVKSGTPYGPYLPSVQNKLKD